MMIRVKVCGLTDAVNAAGVAGCGADYAGFIFYPGSKRFVGRSPNPGLFNAVPQSIRKVGVFVDEVPEIVLQIALQYGLHAVQLHGTEDPRTCSLVKSAGIVVIKAFGVGEEFDFQSLAAYAGHCDFFLFDAITHMHGGSGRQFSWDLLRSYRLDIPFFLGGGIGPSDVKTLRSLHHQQLHAVDINSRFETSPGMKDVELISHFIREVKNKS